MASTYTPIATTTLSGVSTYTFSSISGIYTDIEIRGTGFASGDSGIDVRFNSDSGSNYSYTYMYTDGSSAVSGRNSSVTAATGGRSGTNGSTAIFYLQNYSNSTTYKTMLSRGGNAGDLTIAVVSLWRSTSAITSVTLSMGSNFLAGTTFTLYGIKGA
jgi:hypothetical protein